MGNRMKSALAYMSEAAKAIIGEEEIQFDDELAFGKWCNENMERIVERASAIQSDLLGKCARAEKAVKEVLGARVYFAISRRNLALSEVESYNKALQSA